MKETIPEGDFIAMIREYGAKMTARKLGLGIRSVYRRRKNLERKIGAGVNIKHTTKFAPPSVRPKEYPWRIEQDIQDGIVLVGSDAHYWPGPPSLMHRALIAFIKEYRPKSVILNGDVMDLPSASRHGSIMWESRPAISDEIEATQERLAEIESATWKARKIWTFGNHDQRFESRLAFIAPEYAKIHGFHLKDHFPNWEPCWSTWITNQTIVTHRYKSGRYAPYNNTLFAGKNYVTGHLHQAQILAHTDTNGTRWGMDTGCMAETDARAFLSYTEDKSAYSWREGLGLLTFRKGRMMMPELITKWDDSHVQFRGEIFKI